MSLVGLGTVGYLSLKWTKEALLMAAYGKRGGGPSSGGKGSPDPVHRTQGSRWPLSECTLGSGDSKAQLLTLSLKETLWVTRACVSDLFTGPRCCLHFSR